MTSAQLSAYYYADGGVPRGPVPAATLRAMAAEGRIGPDTLVWRQGLPQWVRYREVIWSEESDAVATPALCRCAECGRELLESETVLLGQVRVCGACKPNVIQRWSECGTAAGSLAYAGFWLRFVAAMLDGFLLTIVYYAIAIPVMWSQARRMQHSNQPAADLAVFSAVMVALGLLSIAMHAFYEIGMVGRFGATLGKMALRLRVVRADGSQIGYGRAAGRHFAKYLSQLTAGIGFLLAAFDREKRALHDMVADTRVVRVADPPT